ncbi:unnamed protein product, partial [Vitis vinifera]|uniref:Uncharacterized protein n=1 Tax=Vitis vinifera TaxID=29760 RepID=D7T7F7_VITVI
MVVPEEEAEAVFDNGRSAAAEEGLFLDFEHLGGSLEKEPQTKEVLMMVATPVPFSEKLGERQYDYSWK